MGRKGTDVEVRGKAIRIQLSLNGEVVRRTLKRDGMTIPPSAENLGEARRLAAEIRSRIAAGTFCHSEYFPATRRDGRPLTVGEHLDAWLAVQRIEPSTAAAYNASQSAGLATTAGADAVGVGTSWPACRCSRRSGPATTVRSSR
jgi:hypothetical protein